jgi:hypothetical protein
MTYDPAYAILKRSGPLPERVGPDWCADGNRQREALAEE